jgi:hypothetical protein
MFCIEALQPRWLSHVTSVYSNGASMINEAQQYGTAAGPTDILAISSDGQTPRWALLAVPSISFYRNQVSFKLIKH